MTTQTVLAYFLLAVLCLASVQGISLSKRRAPFYENDLAEKALSGDMADYTNKLIIRLIDAAIDDARDRGASSVEVEEMMRKRSGIRKCFFHAVNCW